jgi:hypothetical protein
MNGNRLFELNIRAFIWGWGAENRHGKLNTRKRKVNAGFFTLRSVTRLNNSCSRSDFLERNSVAAFVASALV